MLNQKAKCCETTGGRVMRQPVNFDELPELLKERVNGCNNVGLQLGGKPLKVLRCEQDQKDHYARCIIHDKPIFGIWDQYGDNINCTWIRESELVLMLNALKEPK